MILRPQWQYKPWWDTDFSRRQPMTGHIVRMWGRLFAPIPHGIAQNDCDHITDW